MCGIVGYIGTKKACPILLAGLSRLEYRGYDSAGISTIEKDGLSLMKDKGRVKNLSNLNGIDKLEGTIGIAHTRWATHGKPSKENSHPHQDNSKTFSVVHNGIIENYLELRDELIKMGYNFISETDTEVACALIDSLYKDNILEAITQAITKMRGSFALGILVDGDDNLYATRLTSPLIIGVCDNENYIASDVPAILKYTNKYILLDDYDIAKITDSNITIYNDLKEVNRETLTFSGSMEMGMKNGYEHFMLKEIHEQDKVIKNTIGYYFDGTIDSIITNLPDLTKYNKIDIVACGSAYHTGLVGKSLIEKFADTEVNCEVASEYRYKKSFYDNKTLVILVSQSGETADTLAALRKAKDDGIDTLAIVNVVGSSIAREAKYVLYIKAGCEIAVATTKAYTAQLAIFSLIAINLAYTKKLLNKDELNEIIKEINNLPNIINKTLKNTDYIDIAKKIYKRDDIFFIGRGIDYALSMEGSLKLKEISYINSMAYAAGELKHGTISLIEDGTPVIAISTDKDLTEKTVSNIKEVKARDAYTLFVTNNYIEGDFYDDIIVVDKIHELLQPIITIIPLQLLSYEVARLNGCDIDKPRNLAKSVTVE